MKVDDWADRRAATLGCLMVAQMDDEKVAWKAYCWVDLTAENLADERVAKLGTQRAVSKVVVLVASKVSHWVAWKADPKAEWRAKLTAGLTGLHLVVLWAECWENC